MDNSNTLNLHGNGWSYTRTRGKSHEESLNVTQSLAGLIITTHGLFIALFSPLRGEIIDKIGAKRPYVIGLILYGITGVSGFLIASGPSLISLIYTGQYLMKK